VNSILTTAMTWTIGSGAGVILASQVIEAELAPLSRVSERIADATEHNAHEAARDSIKTLLAPSGWTNEGAQEVWPSKSPNGLRTSLRRPPTDLRRSAKRSCAYCWFNPP
jgi:hypothetical protein